MDLKTETWGREINEIINYDSKELFLNDTKINSSGCIYRLHNRIFFMNDATNVKDYEKLIEINKTENRYELNFNKFEFDKKGNINTINSAWFLLKSSKMKAKYNKYRLKKGDVIKIGRIFTRIKDIKFEKNKKSKKGDENSSIDFEIISNKSKNGNSKIILMDVDNLNKKKEINNKNRVYSLANQRNATDSNLEEKIQILNLNKMNNNKNKSSDNNIKSENDNANNNNIIIENKAKKLKPLVIKSPKICRICYSEEESPLDNPLVQPCKCSGSLKYIHLNCLKHWIMTRSCLKVEEGEFCSVFLFKEVECEICKEKLPDLVNHKGKIYYLLDFSDIFKSYFILETLTLDEEGNKFIYVISLLNKEIKIGRGILSDILLSDVSVSRIHCIIEVEGNNVFIIDNDSKFGTLLLIQTPMLKMIENLPLFIQVGRTFLNFEIKKEQNKFFSCCDVSESANAFFYYNQNDKQVKLNSVFTMKTDVDNKSEDEIESKKEEEIKKEKNNNDNVEDIKDDKDKEDIVIIDNNEDESIKIIIENE